MRVATLAWPEAHLFVVREEDLHDLLGCRPVLHHVSHMSHYDKHLRRYVSCSCSWKFTHGLQSLLNESKRQAAAKEIESKRAGCYELGSPPDPFACRHLPDL